MNISLSASKFSTVHNIASLTLFYGLPFVCIVLTISKVVLKIWMVTYCYCTRNM